MQTIINKNNQEVYGFLINDVTKGTVIETETRHKYVVVTEVINNVALVTPVSKWTTPSIELLDTYKDMVEFPKVCS